MRNKLGNGIYCDYCFDHYGEDFVYYSLDFKEIVVYQNRGNIKKEVVFSADLCTNCMEAIKDRVIKSYKPPIKSRFVCDISGEIIKESQFKAYKCYVSKVIVSMANQPYTCISCGAESQKGKSCPKCNQPECVRRADVLVDKEYLELNFSSKMFNKFTGFVDRIKLIVKENSSGR